MEFQSKTDNSTIVKVSNKQQPRFIEQMTFFGVKPIKVSSRFTYYLFPGDIPTTMDMLGYK